jgi:hypothetical protein
MIERTEFSAKRNFIFSTLEEWKATSGGYKSLEEMIGHICQATPRFFEKLGRRNLTLFPEVILGYLHLV